MAWTQGKRADRVILRRLREVRENRRMPRRILVGKLNAMGWPVCELSISRYERLIVGCPKGYVRKLASALGVKVKDLK